jgi:VWFA-related protein
MARSLRGLIGASLMLGLLLGTAGDPAAAQQSAGGQPPTFRTGVNFVKVDVIVTDGTGRPALDLSQGDFQVTENGKPQTVESFKLVKLDGGVAPTPDGPPKAIRNDADEELEAARDDVRLFAIFLDDYHVRRLNSLSVRESLSTFIETELGPSDMITVMSPLQPVSSLRMTRNRAAVAQAVRGFVGRKYDYQPRNDIERQYSRQPAETVEQVRSQVSMTAIRGLVTHMGSLKEGRKALILVSEGFISALPPELTYQVAEDGLASGLTGGTGFFGFANMQKDLQEVYDTANRNNVAIYVVDPRGLAVSEFDIEQRVQGQADREFLSATRDTLRTLAEQTDGRAVINRNNLGEGMKQIVRDTSGYYLLGYNSTQSTADGKFHEIKVSVNRPGVQVRARKGYWALTAEDTARAVAPPAAGPSRAVESALASISQPADARVIRTWVGMSRGENGKTRITFVWEPAPRVPGSRAAAEADSPSRVTLVALAPDGAPYFRGAVPDGAGAANRAGAASGGARVTFEANPGPLQLRVSVEGLSTRQLDAETRELAVPDLGVSQTSLGTPAVLRGRTLPEFQQIKADSQAVPIVAREFSRSDRLLVRIPAYGPGGTVPTLGVRLLNKAGQAMRELAAASSGAPGVQQIEVPLAGLAPGDYLIEIRAPGDGGDATEIIGFRITS